MNVMGPKRLQSSLETGWSFFRKCLLPKLSYNENVAKEQDMLELNLEGFVMTQRSSCISIYNCLCLHSEVLEGKMKWDRCGGNQADGKQS